MEGTAGSQEPRGSGRATSHDVADAAGVSQATVARVFSRPDKVADATAARVRAAATRLGYVPNAIARSLKSQRTDMIGAVVPATGEYWQHVLTAFSRRLADRGRQLLVFSFAEPAQVDDVLDAVTRYRLDGLIAASANIDGDQLAALPRLPLPVVAFNQPAAAGVVPSVSIDNSQGMTALVDLVADRGARTVTYVRGVTSVSTDQIRFDSATTRLRQRGCSMQALEAGAFSYEAGHKIAGPILDAIGGSDTPPDAVMVAGDELAFGVIDGLRDRGVTAPDDLLITGFDGLPQAAWSGYDLTTYEQPTELLVERAIERLLDADGAADGHADIIAGTIRQGRTTDNG